MVTNKLWVFGGLDVAPAGPCWWRFFFFTVDLHNPKPPDSALKRRAKPRDGTALRNKVLRPPFNSKAGETWGALEFPRYRPLSLKGWQCQPLPLPPFQACPSGGLLAHIFTPPQCAKVIIKKWPTQGGQSRQSRQSTRKVKSGFNQKTDLSVCQIGGAPWKP